MQDAKYQICSRCVMDTTDPEIIFDEQGVCNHCHQFDEITRKRWFPNEEGKNRLETIFSEIKDKGKKHEYDCIIGLSGGVDSSYLALVMKDYGLRPLVVHVDAGWNSELAVYNIEQIVKHCGYDLHTHVMDWSEIKDLQCAYLKAGVANQDVVQDHAFFASLYHFAVLNNIKYVISGGNIATESVFPKAWQHGAMDSINLKAIHKKFGKRKLVNYKTISFIKYYFYYPFVKGMTVVRPLNFMPYHKQQALEFLKDSIGYKEYGRKHGESRFTKFYQNYYLPTKFNIDKRRAHLSSQILSGELTREIGLAELQKPLYDEAELYDDKAFIAKKLGITIEELGQLTYSPGHEYSDYANWDSRYKIMLRVKSFINKIIGRNIKGYS
ncbi:N-acetyl sugar amidotransferase [uncultured Endozoicomonas sp.]|uniref:N-acetyl sugar amidotransferase n=1 Tax=uncultured Endozoicomonas sp. TaxID=432652 RepID=UPI002625DC91|nr:N-acetyl sugar amidotransferase [uncultured Endozoicomonas sp.]